MTSTILFDQIVPCFFLQEVHEILKEYELKYCFVDRNKGTGKTQL